MEKGKCSGVSVRGLEITGVHQRLATARAGEL
jgi:hypothetical protein